MKNTRIAIKILPIKNIMENILNIMDNSECLNLNNSNNPIEMNCNDRTKTKNGIIFGCLLFEKIIVDINKPAHPDPIVNQAENRDLEISARDVMGCLTLEVNRPNRRPDDGQRREITAKKEISRS